MKIRTSAWLLSVIATSAALFWWLMIDADAGLAPPKPIHIGELRALAAIMPGRRPAAVTYTLLATRKTMGDYYAVGIGLQRRPLAIVGWTLPVPGKGAIVINPDAPPAAAKMGIFAASDHAAQQQLAAATRNASLILYTQRVQREPLRAPAHLGKTGSSVVRPATNLSVQRLPYTTARAVAPGVVIIPASSHAAGARLIFVQLTDGREFLFAGDLAVLRENWSRLRARSHLAAIWGPAQDRSETYAWLRTIRQLKTEAPILKIVPGYDYAWMVRQQSRHFISEFTPQPAPIGKPR